jgi:hypothetical protein
MLRPAGVVAGSGDLALSPKKAWHGMGPVYRHAQGRFGLSLSSASLKHILRTAGLRASRFAAPAHRLRSRRSRRTRYHSPRNELDVAFCDRFTSGFSALRQTAAVFDAQAGVPVDVVVGSVPGWADPWSRARRVVVVNIERGS